MLLSVPKKIVFTKSLLNAICSERQFQQLQYVQTTKSRKSTSDAANTSFAKQQQVNSLSGHSYSSLLATQAFGCNIHCSARCNIVGFHQRLIPCELGDHVQSMHRNIHRNLDKQERLVACCN